MLCGNLRLSSCSGELLSYCETGYLGRWCFKGSIDPALKTNFNRGEASNTLISTVTMATQSVCQIKSHCFFFFFFLVIRFLLLLPRFWRVRVYIPNQCSIKIWVSAWRNSLALRAELLLRIPWNLSLDRLCPGFSLIEDFLCSLMRLVYQINAEPSDMIQELLCCLCSDFPLPRNYYSI